MICALVSVLALSIVVEGGEADAGGVRKDAAEDGRIRLTRDKASRE